MNTYGKTVYYLSIERCFIYCQTKLVKSICRQSRGELEWFTAEMENYGAVNHAESKLDYFFSTFLFRFIQAVIIFNQFLPFHPCSFVLHPPTSLVVLRLLYTAA